MRVGLIVDIRIIKVRVAEVLFVDNSEDLLIRVAALVTIETINIAI